MVAAATSSFGPAKAAELVSNTLQLIMNSITAVASWNGILLPPRRFIRYSIT